MPPPPYRPHLVLVPVLCFLAQQHPLGGCLGVKQLLHASPPTTGLTLALSLFSAISRNIHSVVSESNSLCMSSSNLLFFSAAS